MIPKRCSIRYNGKDCLNPPAYIVSMVEEDGEYMIGMVCREHKDIVEGLVKKGEAIVKFEELKYVGTDCIL